MQAAIGYLRVSTPEQGRSGLGLAAQRNDIEEFSAREGFSIKSWHQDVQTGRGADALLLRPGLAAALKEARAARCPLIVSRLDRLSRNVHFISGLMEHRVHFMVAAFGRVCDNFVLHIHASVAEQERKMISERLKAAFAAAKRRGKKFGLQLHSKVVQRRIIALGHAAQTKAAMERAEAFRLHIEWALRQPSLISGRQISFASAAQKLNDPKHSICSRRALVRAASADDGVSSWAESSAGQPGARRGPRQRKSHLEAASGLEREASNSKPGTQARTRDLSRPATPEGVSAGCRQGESGAQASGMAT